MSARGFTVGRSHRLASVVTDTTMVLFESSTMEDSPTEESVSKISLTPEELKEIDMSPIFFDSPTASTYKSLAPEALIQIAKRFLVKTNGIGGDENLLSEDFVFLGPVVGPFGKKTYLDAIGSIDFVAAFPDWNPEFYSFRVDPFDTDRVWYMTRGRGTNTGPFPTKDLAPTYKEVINPPQICSLTIDSKTGLIKKYTIGYVADRTIGNTGGLGGLYGILYAIGRPLPFPEAMPWRPSLPYLAFQKIGGIMNKLRGD